MTTATNEVAKRYVQKTVIVAVDEPTVDEISDARDLLGAPVDARVSTVQGFQFSPEGEEPFYSQFCVSFTWLESL